MRRLKSATTYYNKTPPWDLTDHIVANIGGPQNKLTSWPSNIPWRSIGEKIHGCPNTSTVSKPVIKRRRASRSQYPTNGLRPSQQDPYWRITASLLRKTSWASSKLRAKRGQSGKNSFLMQKTAIDCATWASGGSFGSANAASEFHSTSTVVTSEILKFALCSNWYYNRKKIYQKIIHEKDMLCHIYGMNSWLSRLGQIWELWGLPLAITYIK